MKKNGKKVLVYQQQARQTSISAFFIIQQVNFILSPFMIIGNSWSRIELGCPLAHTTQSETENKLHLNLIKM